LRNIDELTAPTGGVSEDFTRQIFSSATFVIQSGKNNREYLTLKVQG